MNRMSRHRPALLIDRGNSRLKWALLGPQGLGVQHAESAANWDARTLIERVIEPAGQVAEVLVANVAGIAFERELIAALERTRRLVPCFVRTTAAACGIRNAYPEPARLGVDRWVTMIAAWDLEPRSACIVDVGTAMTVDALDDDGNHLGGLITPGPDLMVASLMSSTSNIRSFAADGRADNGFFADNTFGAIRQGAVAALAALVERALQAVTSVCGSSPRLLLTGGSCELVATRVRAPLTIIPTLVLQGLAVCAERSSDD
jgi:type III pantothenate kinase